MAENLNFSADVTRLLDIVVNALYSNRDVFLRELVANAADACDRRRYDGIATPALLPAEPLTITIVPDAKTRTVAVIDNGIGMTRDDLVAHLGTIARSGTKAIMEQIKSAGKGSDLSLIGQFGVGFYASFMAADTVDVVTRRAGSDEIWHWHSDGRSGYTIEPASAELAAWLNGQAGTAVICHIKDDASDYLLDAKIEQIIKMYADHITFPIYLAEHKDGKFDRKNDGNPINQASALWTRPKSEITPEQYQEFFNYVSLSFGTDEPLATAHWKAEGKIEFTALLFVPSLRPWDLYDASRSHAVRLYVRRVFITDQCDGLVYPWLRFLRGVIDSEDLPLNISREMLQKNPVVTKIRSAVATRILGDLAKLAESDPIKFKVFSAQFGAVLKEGLYDAVEHRADLFKVCRFYASEGGEDPITLDQYLGTMKPGQDHIYYFSGETRDGLMTSPQLEGFRARGLNVLFMTDTVDDFWLPTVGDYQGKKFQSITKGAIDLSAFPVLNNNDTAKPDEKPARDDIDQLIKLMKEILADDVGDVRVSDRLTSSPVCLVAGENDVDMKMDRVLKIHQKYESHAKRILEINPAHPLVKNLAARAKCTDHADPTLTDSTWLLYDQARIIQGEPVADPGAFAERMGRFLLTGTSN